jgi:hypothetical protein
MRSSASSTQTPQATQQQQELHRRGASSSWTFSARGNTVPYCSLPSGLCLSCDNPEAGTLGSAPSRCSFPSTGQRHPTCYNLPGALQDVIRLVLPLEEHMAYYIDQAMDRTCHFRGT